MKKKFQMPSALTIVMLFMIVVAILTWFVPTSVVITNEQGESEIIYNAAFDEAGNVIQNAGTNPVGIWDLFTAPIKGFVNAAEVAMMFSGGGHLRAAGCSNLPGTIEQVKNQMINRIRSCLK